MQVVHEAGHAMGAWMSGGKVIRVVLHPFTISRTDVQPNPHPLIVVWAGPLVGVLFPIVVWFIAVRARLSTNFLRFFAGFCLIANGCYIGFGSFGGVGDCGEMLRHGTPPWVLWPYGLVTASIGLWLCDQSRDYFGLGKNSASKS